jgi:hypothetical protein
MADVRVIVVPDPEKSTTGRIDPNTSMSDIRDDIVKSLELGEPSDWTVAVAPADPRGPLNRYSPSSGDTIYVLRVSQARGPAFVKVGTPI